MAKKSKVKVEDNTLTIEADNIEDALDVLKPIEITSASIKEQKCNYGYEIKTGPSAGDTIPTRNGKAMIHEDMNHAFAELKVHLAIAADAFKHVFAELPVLEELKKHEITEEFTVSGFKTKGKDEDEGYILIGDKYVTLGIMDVSTQKITAGSNYKFFEELRDAISNARKEVELYMNGKHSDEEDDEENQPELPFGAGKTSAEEFDEEE